MAKRILIRDQRLRWNSAEAYEHLAQRLQSTGAKPVSPNSTAQEIRMAIAGAICRCTGYKNIVAAVRWAAEYEDEAAPKQEV